MIIISRKAADFCVPDLRKLLPDYIILYEIKKIYTLYAYIKKLG